MDWMWICIPVVVTIAVVYLVILAVIIIQKCIQGTKKIYIKQMARNRRSLSKKRKDTDTPMEDVLNSVPGVAFGKNARIKRVIFSFADDTCSNQRQDTVTEIPALTDNIRKCPSENTHSYISVEKLNVTPVEEYVDLTENKQPQRYQPLHLYDDIEGIVVSYENQQDKIIPLETQDKSNTQGGDCITPLRK